MAIIKDEETGHLIIWCDCCGNHKLAEIRGDSLIIRDRRHGKLHFVVLALDKLQKSCFNLRV